MDALLERLALAASAFTRNAGGDDEAERSASHVADVLADVCALCASDERARGVFRADDGLSFALSLLAALADALGGEGVKVGVPFAAARWRLALAVLATLGAALSLIHI